MRGTRWSFRRLVAVALCAVAAGWVVSAVAWHGMTPRVPQAAEVPTLARLPAPDLLRTRSLSDATPLIEPSFAGAEPGSCLAWFDCAIQCVEQVCVDECTAALSPEGRADHDAAMACVAAACPTCPDGADCPLCSDETMISGCTAEFEKCRPSGTDRCPEMLECEYACPQEDFDCRFACRWAATIPAQGMVAAFDDCFFLVCPPPSTDCYLEAEAACRPYMDACQNDVPCQPSCGNHVCGDDGCGGSCGACEIDSACIGGACVVQGSCIEYSLCRSGCLPGDGACETDCQAGLSGQGQADLDALGACRATACPTFDEACLLDAMTEACTSQYEACMPHGTGTCQEVFNCDINCHDDRACEEGCRALGTVPAQGTFGLVKRCVTSLCSLADMQCVTDALNGTCAPIWNTCAGGGTCTPSCNGIECGDDGCGGSCGACGTGETCFGGRCQPVQEGSCLQYTACLEPCGGDPACQAACEAALSPAGQVDRDALDACLSAACPSCAPGSIACERCRAQALQAACTPQYEACYLTGTQGCRELLSCTTNACVRTGTGRAQGLYFDFAWCINEACPTYDEACLIDAYGNACATAAAACQADTGACVPSCAGRQCGDDGCGGSCGVGCPPGVGCVEGLCTATGTATCIEYFACTGACGEDGTCQQACGAALSPEGLADYSDLTLCERTACPACYETGAGCGECIAQIMQGPCTIQYEACLAHGAMYCGGTLDCADACTDDACRDTCNLRGTIPAQGKQLALSLCVQQVCAGASDPAGCEAEARMTACMLEYESCLGDGPCLPACGGRECGDDGCGGSCGTCDPGRTCVDGTCRVADQGTCVQYYACVEACGGHLACVTTCEGRLSPDGQADREALEACLFGACPSCATGDAACELCAFQAMQAACTPEYEACHPAGTLGCRELLSCTSGSCVSTGTIRAQGLFGELSLCMVRACPEFDPACYQQAMAGPCAAEADACNADTSACVPECTGRECGDDGCGGTCGSGCVAGVACLESHCAASGTATCTEYVDCRDGCLPDDGACREACGALLSIEGHADYVSLLECVESSCPGCMGSTGGACGECLGLIMQQRCTGAYEACHPHGTTFCGGILDCSSSCSSPACVTDCAATGTIPAQGKYLAMSACVQQVCLEATDPEACWIEALSGPCSGPLQACLEDGTVCVPSCDGRECGSDGCGGTCGGCLPTYGCVDGTCRDPGDCHAYTACLAGCTDSPCEAACEAAASPAGLQAYADMQACFATMCPGCATGDPDCSVCRARAMQAACSSEYGACYPAGSWDCGQVFDCVMGCGGTLSCIEDCKLQGTVQAQGKALEGQLCMLEACPNPADWMACVSSGGACNGIYLACRADNCVPDCTGRQCGDDGCGGSCGSCPATGNPCIATGCELGRCSTAPLDGQTCDDLDPCTTNDRCLAGVCGGTEGCDDQVGCTVDTCVPGKGCVHAPDDSLCAGMDYCWLATCDGQIGCVLEPRGCDDGIDCTEDSCLAQLGCVHAPRHGACQDGNECTVDECDPFGGEPMTGCTHAAVLDGFPCDDGNECTANDACARGDCLPGSGVTCEDDDPCTDDACDPLTGCTFPFNTAPCDDGDACTTGEACSLGACVGGSQVPCDDLNPCTDDSCDPATGCGHANNTAPCDDGDACTKDDACGNGSCQPGSGVTCEDGNACTGNWCDKELGCLGSNVEGPCDDGDECTIDEACHDGECGGGYPVTCEDYDPCTDNRCLPSTGCDFPYNTAACDDFNECTAGDVCAEGKCAGTAILCDDEDVCTRDSCDEATGCVHDDLRADCDDYDPCTDDSCDPVTGCYHVANAEPCNDGSDCTERDTCSEGTCAGTDISCDDANPCTDDSCDPATGCVHAANTATCDDGNACTADDRCGARECVGTDVLCDDGNECTDDDCDMETGCENLPTYGACDDENPCTLDDQCGEGTCVGELHACLPGPCDEAVTCDGAGGCTRVRMDEGTACDDGDPCTDDDECKASGLCEGVPSPACAADGLADVPDAATADEGGDAGTDAGGEDAAAEVGSDEGTDAAGPADVAGDPATGTDEAAGTDPATGTDEAAGTDTATGTDEGGTDSATGTDEAAGTDTATGTDEGGADSLRPDGLEPDPAGVDLPGADTPASDIPGPVFTRKNGGCAAGAATSGAGTAALLLLLACLALVARRLRTHR